MSRTDTFQMKLSTLLIGPIIFTAAFFCPGKAAADIYYYVDSDGVACFTDAPTTPDAVVVMKEARGERSVAKRKKVPLHLAATGIDNKIGKDGNYSPRGTGELSLPIKGRITSLAGLRHDPIDGTLRMHNGVDIAAPSGTPIKPALPGTVVFSGSRPGYGNMVVLEHADGTITLYAHNLQNVKVEGEYAQPEDTIALLGSTGRSTGPHLHFEAWRDGENITPSFTGTATASAGSEYEPDAIRMTINPDGSLLLTNLN